MKQCVVTSPRSKYILKFFVDQTIFTAAAIAAGASTASKGFRLLSRALAAAAATKIKDLRKVGGWTDIRFDLD